MTAMTVHVAISHIVPTYTFLTFFSKIKKLAQYREMTTCTVIAVMPSAFSESQKRFANLFSWAASARSQEDF